MPARFDVLGVDLGQRPAVPAPQVGDEGTGRELFRLFRNAVSSADSGATIFGALGDGPGMSDEPPSVAALAGA